MENGCDRAELTMSFAQAVSEIGSVDFAKASSWNTAIWRGVGWHGYCSNSRTRHPGATWAPASGAIAAAGAAARSAAQPSAANADPGLPEIRDLWQIGRAHV